MSKFSDDLIDEYSELELKYDAAVIEIAALGADLDKIGNAYLRLKTATDRADKTLSKLTLDKDNDPLTRASIRNVVLDLRAAQE